MTSIRFSDFGPPYSWPILRQLSSAFGWPSECSVHGEADDDDDDGDEDVCSYLPLLDEFLAWRDNAHSRDPPKPPRPPSPLPTKVGQTAQRCRLIHGLCFEGGEEISLDYLGPSHVNGYDSETDSVEPMDDSPGNDGQAGWSIHQHGEHEPENNQTTEAAAGTRCDRKTAVRNEDRGGDGTSSTAFESQVVAGAREHSGGEESSPDARPIETISSATRRAARCFLFVVEDVQSKVQRVRSAIASLFSRNRGIPAEATAVVGEPEASVYEFACELNGGEHEAAILPAQSEPEDDRTRKVKTVSEQCDEDTPLHSLGSVLLEGCSAYDDRKYGDACSTEASSPAAAKAGRRLNDALETQESQFNDLRITEATLPQHHVSASEPSGSYFDSLCVTVASSPEIRDSSVEPSHEVEVNITDGGPSNEVIVGNATDDVEILDDEPQEGETMNIAVAAENCCQTTLSLPVPLQVGSSHEEVWCAGTYASQKICPATSKDGHLSLESSDDRGGGDGADRVVTLLPRVRHGYAERFREIDLNLSTSLFEFEPDIEDAHQGASNIKRGFSVGEAPNAATRHEDGNQVSSQKSLHIKAAPSQNDEKEKYRDAFCTQASSPASARPADSSAGGLDGELEGYSGAGYITDSLPATHNSSVGLFRPVDSNCVAKGSETEPDIEEGGGDIPVEEETSRDHDALSPATQPQSVSSPKHNPESLPVALSRLRIGAFNDDASHDTTPVTLEHTESSKADSVPENAITTALAVSLPGARDSCTENVLEVYSDSSADRSEFDQQTKEDDEVILITDDTSTEDDSLNASIQNRTTLSPENDPKSQLVACAQVRSNVTEVNVPHDTTPVRISDIEISRASSFREGDLSSALPSIFSEALDSCLQIFRGFDSNFSADQQIGETNEVVTQDRSQDNDTVSTATRNRSLGSMHPPTRTPFYVLLEDASLDKMPVVGDHTDASGANSSSESAVSSALSSLSGARESCTEAFHRVDYHSSADGPEYESGIKQADEVLATECSSRDDTLSTAIQNQSLQSLQCNAERLLVACSQRGRDVSDHDDVLHDTMPVTTGDAEYSGVNSIRNAYLPSAPPSLSDVDYNFPADHWIEEIGEALAVKGSSHDIQPLNSAVRNPDKLPLEHSIEPPLVARTQAQPDFSANDFSQDTTPITPTDTDFSRAMGIRENYFAALPSLAIVVPRCSADQWIGEIGKPVVTETASQNKDTSNLNTDAMLVPSPQTQSGASENDVPRDTTPVTDKRIESSESNFPLENSVCSDLQLIEGLRVASQHGDKNVSEASVFESPFRKTAAKATPQNSQDDQPPEESPPQTITRLPSDIIECINTLSSLPIWDFCPPSHTTSAASRPSPQLSLTSRSEGEIRSDDEPDHILPSNLPAEEGAPGGGNVDHEYEPETFPPSTPISAITLSEGEIVDSDSDQSIAFPALNEAEKFGFKDPAKTSKSSTSCTRTYTDDEGTTSSDSSSSSTRSSSSSSSTQTSSGSESDTESRLSSPSLSESPQPEIQEAKTAKAAMIRKKKAVNDEYAAEAAGRSEPCYTQNSPSGTNLPARNDDQENGSLSTLASALVLKDHKKDDAEDDADILIPLLLNTTFNTEDVAEAAHFEPRFIQPASPGSVQPDRHDDQENNCHTSSASTSALKEDSDMLIPLSLPVFLTRPSEKDSVGSGRSLTASPTAPPFAPSPESCGNKSDSTHDSAPLVPLSPSMERLSGDGEAALILDELPRPPKRKWRKRKRQQRRALWRRPYGRFRSNFVNTENIRKGVSPETSWPPGRHKRPPLVTDDPAENRDNEDPEWEPMRRLTCDEERYKAVSRVWHSRRAPDPQEDLTTFHYRRRTLGIGRSALPSSRSRRKRKASRDSQRDSDEAKRQRLDTEIFDSKIAEAKQDREREMEKARDKLNRCLREVRKERRRRGRRDDSSSSSSRRPKRGRSNSSSRSRGRRSSSRRSRRRHSSSDSDSLYRRRRRSKSRSSQVERDSSTARSGRRRRPSRDTGGYSSSRRRSGRSRSSEDGRSSTLSSERSEGGYSSKSRRRGRRRRRRRSESATDSSRSYRSYRSSRSRRSRRRTPDSGDSSPRRRRRRGSSESSGGYATSRRSRSRRHSQSDYDRSPSYRSRDGSDEGSRYWKMRERKIRDDFEADRQDISSKYHAEVDKLVAVRREVSRVNDFYTGLTHTDPRMLSASNVCDYQKLDSMLREMEKTYATAAWR